MTQAPAANAGRTLAAARKLFFDKGFAGTSSTEIARLAGTSKAVIYAHYGNMEGLLRAVIEAEVARFGAIPATPIRGFDDFRATTVGFGATLLRFLSDPETIRFSRMMHEQARARPDVTRLYFQAAYEGTCASLAVLLAAGAPFSATSLTGPGLERAERYVAFLKGHRYEMAVLGLTDAPYPDPDETGTACFDAHFRRLEGA